MALMLRRNPDSYIGRLSLLKKLFWLYFFLLIFEGSLRKWVVPQLTAPLLLIRDPVSLMIIWEAYRSGKWPRRWTQPLVLLTVMMLAIFTIQIAAADNHWLVGLFGLRSYLLPFPVMFIMGENLDEEDLRRLGACTLWLMLPMVLLEAAQYLAPTSSFLNKASYEGASQIGYVGGHVRASGTFSYAVGVVHFDTLAAAFIFYGLIRRGVAKTWLLWASTFALLISIPTTGARTLATQLALVVACVGFSAMMGLSQFTRVLRIIVAVAILAYMASFLPVFSDAVQSMTERFSGATAVEGGTVESSLYLRTIGQAVNAFEDAVSSDQWIGLGIGRGAVAVEAFLTGGHEAVAGEDEFSRELVEMGPIVGSAFILFKLLLVVLLFGRAVARARDLNPLALLLIPLILENLFWGLYEQPTIQGFAVIGVAFSIAAANVPEPARQEMLPQPLQSRQLLYLRRTPRS